MLLTKELTVILLNMIHLHVKLIDLLIDGLTKKIVYNFFVYFDISD